MVKDTSVTVITKLNLRGRGGNTDPDRRTKKAETQAKTDADLY